MSPVEVIGLVHNDILRVYKRCSNFKMGRWGSSWPGVVVFGAAAPGGDDPEPEHEATPQPPLSDRARG